jgi:hypothetical protein
VSPPVENLPPVLPPVLPPTRPSTAALEPPKETALACIVGEGDLRDFFAAQLRQMVTGRIVAGDCSQTLNGAVIQVSGIASTPSAGATCSTPDKHVYELAFTIDKAGKVAGSIPPAVATRCGNRDRDLDRKMEREARNDAVLQAVRRAHQLLDETGVP